MVPARTDEGQAGGGPVLGIALPCCGCGGVGSVGEAGKGADGGLLFLVVHFCLSVKRYEAVSIWDLLNTILSAILNRVRDETLTA